MTSQLTAQPAGMLLRKERLCGGEERDGRGGKGGEEEEEKAWPGKSPALPLSGTGRTVAGLRAQTQRNRNEKFHSVRTKLKAFF